MAKYNIKSLNYVACGETRNFVNMDVELGYELCDVVHLLCAESGTTGYPDVDSWRAGALSSGISVDIGTEHGEGYYYPSDYIYRNRDTPLAQEGSRTALVLNEQQPRFVETDSGSRKYVRLYLSCCTETMLQKIKDFNGNRAAANMTYLLENTPNDRNGLSGDNGVALRGAYDLQDVSVKRLGRFEFENNAVLGKAIQYRGSGRAAVHHDVYAAPLAGPPIGFCQAASQTDFENDAVVVTQGTTGAPLIMRTDIEGHRRYDDMRAHYDVELAQMDGGAYTYKPYYDSAETTEEDARASIAPDAVALSAYSDDDVARPVRSYQGVYRSYVLDLPLDQRFPRNDVEAPYSAGEIYYRRMLTTKSLYDSQYSTRMDSVSCVQRARTYCGVGTCAGKPYLKYWDGDEYTAPFTDPAGGVAVLPTERGNAVSRGTGLRPYQKIEYMYPTDHMQAARHKSNVFSVEILATGISDAEKKAEAALGSASSEERQEAALRLEKLGRLKRDIEAAVKEIARNVTPANTQLFGVYFNDN